MNEPRAVASTDAWGGTLLLVVGPSGVGKDALIAAARTRFAGDPLHIARRTITRPGNAGGEAHEPMAAEAFEAAERAGAFALLWRAHGLAYGVRTEEVAPLTKGQHVLVNASRRALPEIAAAFPEAVVLSVTARAEVLRARLQARGRESATDQDARLRRTVPAIERLRTIEVPNDGALADGEARFCAAILGAVRWPLRIVPMPLEMAGGAICVVHREAAAARAADLAGAVRVEVRAGRRSVRANLSLCSDARVLPRDAVGLSSAAFQALSEEPAGTPAFVERSPSPKSLDIVRKKVGGGTLAPAEIARVMRDLGEGRYAPPEIAGFLLAASTNLSRDELVAMTRARADAFTPLRWDRAVVFDKHSLGGVPGSRITPLLVPILAAAGLLVPKTSSRAITSAAGTADVMECRAKVDLDRAGLKAVCETAGGAIAWSGRINHGAVDEVMNAINRPLRIASSRLDLTAILAKKLAVGATHVLIDIPVGPGSKVADAREGEALAALYRDVGAALGLTVDALVSDGSAPIGRGIGPALEMADVEAVLCGGDDAPAALRAKALRFAAHALAMATGEDARATLPRAESLLASGAALARFEAIVAAQGPLAHVAPGAFVAEVAAQRTGRLAAIDGFALAGIARTAGAPADLSAGVKILAHPGEEVRHGAPLLEVVASSQSAADAGAAIAAADPRLLTIA